MGYSDTWKVLEEIVIEFRKKGIVVPEKIITDLRSAKTLIKLLNVVDKDRGEMSLRIEEYLADLEGYLITKAQNNFPPERIDEWLRRVNESSCDACSSAVDAEMETRFVSGVPRDQKWMRVKPIVALPMNKLKEIAGDAGLSCKLGSDGYLIVYGRDDDIKEFVKKMTSQTANT